MSTITTHLDRITRQAGLEVMRGVFDVLRDRETVADAKLLSLTADDIADLYETYVGPAIDGIEGSL